MLKITIEDKNLINELEALQDEVQSRQSIIAYMLSNDYDITTQNFLHYQEEYKQYEKAYGLKKQEVERLYVRTNVDNPISWSLDFQTGELTIVD